jgi:hypothetical protein
MSLRPRPPPLQKPPNSPSRPTARPPDPSSTTAPHPPTILHRQFLVDGASREAPSGRHQGKDWREGLGVFAQEPPWNAPSSTKSPYAAMAYDIDSSASDDESLADDDLELYTPPYAETKEKRVIVEPSGTSFVRHARKGGPKESPRNRREDRRMFQPIRSYVPVRSSLNQKQEILNGNG